MKITVFDLETKLSPGTDCKWDEKDKMGISVGVGFSYVTGEQTTYLDDNIHGLWLSLIEADLVTGFNILEFDIPLLRETLRLKIKAVAQAKYLFGPTDSEAKVQCFEGIDARLNQESADITKKSYDIFPVSKAGAKSAKFDKGFRVDDHLKALYGDKWLKTGHGSMAPQLYKDGKMGELISYCMGDVHRERLLFEQCWYSGQLRSMGYRNGDEAYPIEQPQSRLGIPLNWRLPFTLFPTSDKGLITVAEKFIEPPALAKEPQ